MVDRPPGRLIRTDVQRLQKLQNDKGTSPVAGPFKIACLAFGNNRRRGLALADILRAARDAQQSQHRGHC
jgi:hypothetical protein